MNSKISIFCMRIHIQVSASNCLHAAIRIYAICIRIDRSIQMEICKLKYMYFETVLNENAAKYEIGMNKMPNKNWAF